MTNSIQSNYTITPNTHISLSHSSFSTYKTCPRLFYFKYLENFKPQGINLDIVFGSTVHKMLEVYYETKSINQALTAGSFEWNKNFEAEETDNNELLSKPNIIKGKAFKNWNSAVELFLYYTQDVGKENKDNFKTIKSEFQIEIDLTSHVSLLAVIDGIWEIEGTNYIIEHKTTSWDSVKLLEAQRHSYQPYTYLLALYLDSNHSWHVDNVLINILSYSARQKKDLSFGSPAIQCSRGVITGNSEHLENTTQQYINIGNSILNSSSKADFLCDYSNCINRYNFKCEYYDYCYYGFMQGLNYSIPHREIFKEI